MANFSFIKEPKKIADDDLALQEKKKMYSQNAMKLAQENAFHRIFICFIYIVSLIGISIISIRLAHLVLPDSRQWLTEAQIQAIDKIFFSGAIGGFIANYVKKSSNNSSQ